MFSSHLFLLTALGLGCLLSLLWGNFWKFWIYRHFMKIKIKDRPINILILVDLIIHHLCYSVSLTTIASWMFTDTLAGRFLETFGIVINDDAFCWFMLYIGVFSYHYDAIGSFGICLSRYNKITLRCAATSYRWYILECYQYIFITTCNQ